MKKTLLLLIISASCTAQDTVKIDSKHAFRWYDAYSLQPTYITTINSLDSANNYLESKNEMLLDVSDKCNTALNDAHELNADLEADSKQSKHDAKWKVIWRRYAFLFGSLFIVENGAIVWGYLK